MDSNLQSKLQAFNATPPQGVWDKIADALDADEAYAQRLYHYDEQPPANLWQRIEESIEKSRPAKVIPFSTRLQKPLRYLAAAGIIGVILVTVTLLMKRTEAGALQAGSQTTVPETTQSEKRTAPATASEKPSLNKDQNLSATTNQRNEQNPDELTARADPKNKTNTYRSAGVYSSLHHYVTFTDGDGQLRRVSKKLAGLVNCKDGDAGCQQRLQELRQTMAAKAMTTDFTGILEMLRQLQQKP